MGNDVGSWMEGVLSTVLEGAEDNGLQEKLVQVSHPQLLQSGLLEGPCPHASPFWLGDK
jgi:hypothetical protein